MTDKTVITGHYSRQPRDIASSRRHVPERPTKTGSSSRGEFCCTVLWYTVFDLLANSRVPSVLWPPCTCFQDSNEVNGDAGVTNVTRQRNYRAEFSSSTRVLRVTSGQKRESRGLDTIVANAAVLA